MIEPSEKLRDTYELDAVPAREPVWQWEQNDKYGVIQFYKSSK